MPLPPLMTSHSAAVQDAVIARLAADGPLQALLTNPYVYAGTAPRGAAKQYIVWLGGSEHPKPSFGAGGTEASDTLKIVSNGPGSREAKRIYARIVAALGAPYPVLVAPDCLSSLRCTLIDCVTDPEDANGLTVSGIVRLDWRAYATPTP